jgi:hypothetical protein
MLKAIEERRIKRQEIEKESKDKNNEFDFDKFFFGDDDINVFEDEKEEEQEIPGQEKMDGLIQESEVEEEPKDQIIEEPKNEIDSELEEELGEKEEITSAEVIDNSKELEELRARYEVRNF